MYDEMEVPNGWHARYDHGDCTISVSSSSRGDRRVKITTADLIVWATEVLQTCQDPSTDGAYTFQGTWQVEVTRDPIRDTLWSCKAPEGMSIQGLCSVELHYRMYLSKFVTTKGAATWILLYLSTPLSLHQSLSSFKLAYSFPIIAYS